MHYWPCSEYLETQEAFHRKEAHRLQVTALQPPEGLLRRIAWYLFGGKSRAEATRLKRVQASLQVAERFQQGESGEQALLTCLSKQLDDSWILLQDYLPPPPWRSGGDIDGVLIGPHGVTVFEAKAWKGFFRYSSDQWFYQRSQQAPWETAQHNPTKQALENTERLQQTIQRLGFQKVPVQPLIAMAQDHMVLTIDERGRPAVPVYITSPTAESIRGYVKGKALTTAEVERLANRLLEAAYGKRHKETL